MKKIALFTLLLTITSLGAAAQEVQTLFKKTGPSGGYGALSNKFTTINGEYANMAEIYGGWFINRKFMLGVAGAAVTNNLSVPVEYNADPINRMSWQYGQFGLMTEYVFWSNRVVHFNVNLMSGAGFTLQYDRHTDHWNDQNWDNEDRVYDEDFFFVMEPGAQLEVNLLKWLRLSPGVSYRKTFGSNGVGLGDNALSDWSYNVTLKVGKF